MSKSLLQIVQELQRRVTALETTPVSIPVSVTEKKNEVPPAPQVVIVAAPVSMRGMCPKCGEKPNHFFHVKTCQGKKQDGDKATDRSGTNGTS